MREEIEELLKECGIAEKDLGCEDFVKSELMDSLMVADLVIAIEDKFNIEIDGDDIIPEYFSNIEMISKLIKKYTK
jgi:acyl carrier protein